MKRRAKGSGTVEKTRDGRFRARFPFEANKRETVGIFATEAEAHAALDAICAEMNDSGISRGGTPLSRFVDRLFAKHRDELYSAVDEDEARWATYFAGSDLAAMPVQSLEAADVLDAITGIRKVRDPNAPLSLSSRKALLNIVRGALHLAVAAGTVSRNVLIGVSFADPKGKGRKAKRRKRRSLRWDEFAALVVVAKPRLVVALCVAIWTGARQGELRALHWSDVHNVEKSACTCEEHRTDPHIVIRYGCPMGERLDCSPKSGEIRVVSLFGRALEAFRTMERSPTGIVFASRLKGYRAKGRLVGRKEWTEARKAAGLLWLHWHDLRHTCGTWLVRGESRMGISRAWELEAVKEHLGHTELRTTEIYADQREGALAAEMAAEARGDKPAMSPQQIAQVQSHLRDLNSRPTVYETGHTRSEPHGIIVLEGLARAYVEAAGADAPHAHRAALDLANVVLRICGVETERRVANG